MASSLPRFAGGLRFVRVGVYLMLAQLVLGVVLAVKLLGADTQDDIRSVLTWTEYTLLTHGFATLVMFIGMARSIPELARVHTSLAGIVIAACCFLAATAILGHSYRVISAFVELALAPDPDLDRMLAAADSMANLRYLIIGKSLAYGIGLTLVMRMVAATAALNDQLALRDEAQSMSRAVMVMLGGEAMQQLGGSQMATLGTFTSLLVLGYWLWCHVKLQRFLFNAAHFMVEVHELPLARVHKVPSASAPPPVKPPERPSAPSTPILRPTTTPLPAAPRAETSDGDATGPQFLR